MDNSNDNNPRKNEPIPGQEPVHHPEDAVHAQHGGHQESAYVEQTTNQAHIEPAGQAPIPVEQDYKKHEDNPGPSPEAVHEENDKGAGPVMKWLIPILILIMLIYWFVIRK